MCSGSKETVKNSKNHLNLVISYASNVIRNTQRTEAERINFKSEIGTKKFIDTWIHLWQNLLLSCHWIALLTNVIPIVCAYSVGRYINRNMKNILVWNNQLHQKYSSNGTKPSTQGLEFILHSVEYMVSGCRAKMRVGFVFCCVLLGVIQTAGIWITQIIHLHWWLWKWKISCWKTSRRL